MKRRVFLQRSTSTLAALGLSQASLLMLERYQQVLAEPTRRKLALLIGINQYPTAPLSGCATDVELQRELLIHRFGFQAADILTLTDRQATREAIESAFLDHLINQAQSGDIVVFHFSGYGGTVTSDSSNATRTSLVTVDAPVTQGESIVVNDVLEDTLLLLLRSLPTDKITTVLDASYTYPGKPLQGNFRIRTRPSLEVFQPSQGELALQEHLLSQISIERERVEVQRRSGQMRGVVLSAAKPDQLATEAKWNGFNAGLFTYALTQHLWQATSTTVLRATLGRTTEQVNQLVNHEQQPTLIGQKSQEQPLLPYYLPPLPAQGAEGVVTAVEENGKGVRLWLGGLPAAVLEQYSTNSLLTLLDVSGTAVAPLQLQITARDGLTARAKLYDAPADAANIRLQVGQFVRERVRVFARNVGLAVALDSNLERIERVDAVSALSALPHVSTAIAGEQAADYLFSKIQESQPTQIAALPTANLPAIIAASPVSQSSYGLCSPGRDVITNTVGEGGEAVKASVRRLAPKLQALLAAKLLHLTVNEGSSQVAVRATLETLAPQARTWLRRETLATLQHPSKQSVIISPAETAGLVTLPVGSQIQYRLENLSQTPIYFIVLGLDSSGDLISLYSPPIRTPERSLDATPQSDGASGSSSAAPTTSTEQTSLTAPTIASIAPGETLTLPQTSASFQWLLRKPTGLTETYLLCSLAPFSQTLNTLTTAQRPSGDAPDLHTVINPLEVAQAVLQDLHQASEATIQPISLSPDTIALDTQVWASLRFVYQVV